MSVSLETGSGWTWIAPRDPTVAEENISISNFWQNTSTKDVFMCVGITEEAQEWKKIQFSLI
jgi:hypothetical protein